MVQSRQHQMAVGGRRAERAKAVLVLSLSVLLSGSLSQQLYGSHIPAVEQ